MMFKIFSGKKSKDTLKDRLKLVLTYDRAQISPGKMEELKKDLLAVVQGYFPFERDSIDIQIEQQEDSMRLVANLPSSHKISP